MPAPASTVLSRALLRAPATEEHKSTWGINVVLAWGLHEETRSTNKQGCHTCVEQEVGPDDADAHDHDQQDERHQQRKAIHIVHLTHGSGRHQLIACSYPNVHLAVTSSTKRQT